LARSEIVEITCDICGTTLVDPVTTADRTFGVDGQQYTIDLCPTHAAQLENALAPFAAAARRDSARAAGAATPARQPRRSGRAGMRGVREWARANGFPNLSDRGRVPSEVMTAWQAAGGGDSGDGTGPARSRTRGRARAAAKGAPTRRRSARRGRGAAAASAPSAEA
jgi:nucleoid-associated protein Lsr2